jgi:LytS/YehU family sensor histidine kinase
MALQTLVENSVKYAVSPRPRAARSWCARAATTAASAVSVEDDGPGSTPTHRPAGHGLDLLTGRLAMLYGDRASLGVDSRPGSTTVTIDVPTGSVGV